MSHFGGPLIGLLFLTPCWPFSRRRPGPESRALRWHGVFLFVFLAAMPIANAHAIDALVRVAGAGRLVVEVAGTAAWLFQYRFIVLAQDTWGHRSRRLVYGCCAAVVVLVLFWIGAHVGGSSDAASYYSGYQVRSWPLTGLNLTSGLVTALLGALVMVRWAIAWRHAAGLIELCLSLGMTLFYAAIFGYGLIIILAETIVRLVWGADAGLLAYRQPLYTVLVVGSLVSLWSTQYAQGCKNWLSERLGWERWRRAAKRAAVLLCDRLVLLYGDGAVVDSVARHLATCHVEGYWRLVGEEVARWLSFASTGRVGMRPHQDIIATDHEAANGHDGDPKMIEAQYYANTYDTVAAINRPQRPQVSAGEKGRRIAPVALARLVREGLSPSPIRRTAAVNATWRHGSGVSDTLSRLIRLHRSLLAANEYVTGEMVRLYGDLETVARVERRLDAERMGRYRRAVALEATRWIILTRVGLAAKLAIGLVVGSVAPRRPRRQRQARPGSRADRRVPRPRLQSRGRLARLGPTAGQTTGAQRRPR